MKKNIITDLSRAENPWLGIPGIEITPKGRIFVCWFAGGPAEPCQYNRIYLQISDDDGSSFSEAQVIVDLPGMARAYDPTLWLDPNGVLWLIYNRSNPETGEHDINAIQCLEPDSQDIVWTSSRRLGYDVPFSFRLNKLTVLDSGDWLMPVTWYDKLLKWDQSQLEKWQNPSILWDKAKTQWVNPTDGEEWFRMGQELQGVGISNDQGKTWKLFGRLEAPRWALENMLIQKTDGTVLMYIRTGSGKIWQSESSDRGRTWTVAKTSNISNPGSRFYLGKLKSGRWLLINTPDSKNRKGLYAFLSDDEGNTWSKGLLLDERDKVSYPDAIQDSEGKIFAVHDHDRYGAREVVMSIFTKEDF